MMKIENTSIHRIYRKLFPDYPKELEKAVGDDCNTLLDIGCGSSSPIKRFSKKLFCVGVDAFQPSIDRSREQNIHSKYHKLDVMSLGEKFEENSFDCVLALDLIEHLRKDEGFKLLKMMEKIAESRVIIFTPNGFVPQKEYEDNPWQAHKSGWTVDEMNSLGYSVIGIDGWRPLREVREGSETIELWQYLTIKFWPRWLWFVVSKISQFVVRDNPHHAFNLLCVKEMKS
ncbi:MAG: class I SAM-dependent methyltransferase [Candidatus Heimdallarchaeota archaeon]